VSQALLLIAAITGTFFWKFFMGKRSAVLIYALTFSCLDWILGLPSDAAQVLGLPEDVPEEVLQVQVDETAYSRMDGGLRSTSEYTQEQKRLQVKPENVPARISPNIKQLIDLLRIRKAILDLIPFR
jgi:hypothetical protein